MNNASFAIPGLMTPKACNFAKQLKASASGALSLCVYYGPIGANVFYSIKLPSGGVIKDPAYPLLQAPLSMFYPQFMYTSTVCDPRTTIPNKVINGVPIPITELNESPPAESNYWILSLPPGVLGVGTNNIEVIINGHIVNYQVECPYSQQFSPNDVTIQFAGFTNQKGETYDVGFKENTPSTIIVSLYDNSEWDLIGTLPLRASAEINGELLSLPFVLDLVSKTLSISAPALTTGKGTWKCEYNLWDEWITLACGDLAIV